MLFFIVTTETIKSFKIVAYSHLILMESLTATCTIVLIMFLSIMFQILHPHHLFIRFCGSSSGAYIK